MRPLARCRRARMAVATSVALLGITNTGGTSACALSIQSNDIRGITHSVQGTNAHTYIQNTAATLSQTISSNTFTNLDVNTTGAITFISNNVIVGTYAGMNAYTVNSLLSVNEQSSNMNAVTVYPNPFSDKLKVSVNKNERSEIIIYDITLRKLSGYNSGNNKFLNQIWVYCLSTKWSAWLAINHKL